MKKFLFMIIMSLFIINPSVMAAKETQNILSMEELTIKVMPEFAYHPTDEKKEHLPLLFGYQGTMLNHSDQRQKGQIEIPLPSEEKNLRIGYVADYSSDLSKIYEIEYIIDKEKGMISWTTSEEIQPNEVYKFVIEFYTDSLQVEKEKRTLSYHFKSFADIGLLNVSFIEPFGAKKVVLDPKPYEKQAHADEEGVYSFNFQGVKVDEEKRFTFTYERTKTTPTFELMNKPEKEIKYVNEEEDSAFVSIAAFSVVGLAAAGALLLLTKRKRKRK